MPLKPIENRTAAPGGSTLSSNRFDLGQSLTFHLQVDGGVFVCCAGASVTKPLAYGRQINSRLQESNRGAVAKAVRMQSFGLKAGNVNLGALLILAQQVTNPEPSERLASMIQKDALL